MRYVAVILSFLVFAGCTTNHSRKNEITRIELARSGAWSDWGATISINDSLDYKYWGDYDTIKQRYFIGKVTSKFWDTLNHKLEVVHFKTADTMTNMSVKDANYYELIIHWKGGRKRILRVSVGNPDTVLTLCKWIATTYKTINLQRINHTIKFETVFHNPSIRLSFDSVEFPPPTSK